MNNYDIIVIGAGLTGSILAYELAQYKLKILLIEKDITYQNSTIFSYGGISYWCGTDILTKRMCQESINIYRNLDQELESNIEFREIDLLFTIDKNQNPATILDQYQQFFIKPELLSIKESCTLEPLLNAHKINGSLRFSQGHVNPHKTILAYQQKFKKLGGEININEVNSLIKNNNKIIGIRTNKQEIFAHKIIICAGTFSRQLLQQINVKIPLYFTHAQLIKTVPTDIKLKSLIMSANLDRFTIQNKNTTPEKEIFWDNPNDNIQGTAMEAGAIQFLDGSFCLGQISQIITNPSAQVNQKASEKQIRDAVHNILPSLSNLSGTWHNCQVAFSKSVPFQVGEIVGFKGLSVFSGFTSPFVFVPPLAKHFANYLVNENNKIEDQLQLSFKIHPE